jgi:alpha-L-fucosidase
LAGGADPGEGAWNIGAHESGKIPRVELIGTEQKVNWKQSPESLHVDLPKQYRPAVDYAAALKITLA